jgi:hypothetical protein
MKIKFLVVLAVICLFAHHVSAGGMKDGDKKNDEKKKVFKKKEKREKSCEETTKEERADCDKQCIPGFKPVFVFKEVGKYCEWECSYEALPPPPGAVVKKEKKIVKVTRAPKPKRPKKLRKECSGERVIKFQNCLVKVTGLIAFGDKTRNFDKKFAKLVQKKQKKGARKAKGGKRGGPKKPAQPAP